MNLPNKIRTAVTAGVFISIVTLGLTGCSAPTPEPTRTATSTALSGRITVLAASSLTESFDQIAQEFMKANPGVEITLSYGGSSALAQQIVNGAPVDLFAAASDSIMKSVIDAGLATGSTSFTTNTLEIVTPTGNPANISSLADFAKPDLTIAVCAPEVPCGAAAVKAFSAAGVTPSVDTLEPDVKSVISKITLGEADAGLVYVSDVRAAGNSVAGIPIPASVNAVNNYPITVLSASTNAAVAQAFEDFVLSKHGQQVLTHAGFGSAK